jgi:hypothetical protein
VHCFDLMIDDNSEIVAAQALPYPEEPPPAHGESAAERLCATLEMSKKHATVGTIHP